MNIVITGASQGIGYDTSLKYAAEGHRVVAIARSGDRLEKLLEESRSGQYPGSITVHRCDIQDRDSVVSAVLENFEAVDILINNAGTLLNKPFEDISEEELRYVYEINVFAPFLLIQSLIPYLSGRAHIINIGSVGGVNGTEKFPGLSAYSSSKAAFSCLAECLQAEFEEGTDLTFNSLALGAVKTEMLSKAFPAYEPRVSTRQMAEYIYNFSFSAPAVLRGKTTVVSRTTP